MDNSSRTYVVVISLAWLLILLLIGYAIYDPFRMDRAAARQQDEAINDGAQIYATNCMVCHGPNGEGVVGKPLNRSDLRGDQQSNPDAYRLITEAVKAGRPGSTNPHWVQLSDGSWASFTAMPAWSRDYDGPLNEQQVADVVTFIMQGDWGLVNEYTPPFNKGALSPEKAAAIPDNEAAKNPEVLAQLPKPKGVSDSEYQQAQQLIGKYACLSCHTVGSVGSGIGPNLSNVGSWGVDEQFLTTWIHDAPSVQERAPVYWSNFQNPVAVLSHVPGGEGLDQGQPLPSKVPLGATAMPSFAAQGMTPAEAQQIADYLLNLK